MSRRRTRMSTRRMLTLFAFAVLIAFGITVYVDVSIFLQSRSITTLMPAASLPDSSQSRKPLFFTIANGGFFHMVKNWILNIEDSGIYDYMILCVDSACYEDMIEFNRTQHVLTLWSLQNETESAPSVASQSNTSFMVFAGKNYINFVGERPRQIQLLYNLYYWKYMNDPNNSKYNAVFYMDSDAIVVNRRITDILESHLFSNVGNNTSNSHSDICFVKDCGSSKCGKYGSGKYCSCLIFIPFANTTHDRINNLLDLWYKKAHSSGFDHHGDQVSLNYPVIKAWSRHYPHDPLNICELNWEQFPSGWLMTNHHFVSTHWSQPNHSDIAVIHSNFVIGRQNKISFFKNLSKWMI